MWKSSETRLNQLMFTYLELEWLGLVREWPPVAEAVEGEDGGKGEDKGE